MVAKTLVRLVADADFVRRKNRQLVLSTLRRLGAMSRGQLATATGLSNASITAIGGELILRRVLIEGSSTTPQGSRGRPAIEIGFNRNAGHAAVVELDVIRARCSLVDFAGTLVDRIETPVTPDLFATVRPAEFVGQALRDLARRNPDRMVSLKSAAISVQGILDPTGDSLKWSPIAHIAGESISAPIEQEFGVPVTLYKRGRLLADGARLLYPELEDLPIAAIFIGSTVAMGLSGAGEGSSTEFGHMNHIPDGALCRCGQRGCVESYAADYGVLRSAYGVPDQVPPAAAVPTAAYLELIRLAQSGSRNVMHAFNMAGRAIGFGLSRLMTIAPPAHVVITGPGARAFELMRAEIEAALGASLVCRINGRPPITVHHDEREPIFQGLLMQALDGVDEIVLADLAAEPRLAATP